MKYVITSLNESSERTLSSRWEFVRSSGGVLQMSAETLFPTSSYPGELVWNVASGSFYVRNEANTAWRLAANAPVTAPYVTIGLTGSLTNERSLITSPSINVNDLGSNSTINLAIDDDVVATVSGTRFTGPVIAFSSLSGSLQQLSNGASYIVNGTSILVTTNSSGQVRILNSLSASQSGADNMATYLTLNTTSSLFNERQLSTSGSSLLLTDAGANLTVTLDISSTGSAMTTNGHGVAVNNKGMVTSGSTSWFGQNFWFVTGSSAQPFSNPSTTFRSALSLTASNLTPGTYRVGWTYTYYYSSTTTSFASRIFLLNSASHVHVEEPSDTQANERYLICGSTYVVITGSTALFAIQAATESGTSTLRLYDRAIELWKVS